MFRSGVLTGSFPDVRPDRAKTRSDERGSLAEIPRGGARVGGEDDVVVRVEPASRGALAVVVIVVASDAVVLLLALFFLLRLFF
jgi:hypothetical protein